MSTNFWSNSSGGTWTANWTYSIQTPVTLRDLGPVTREVIRVARENKGQGTVLAMNIETLRHLFKEVGFEFVSSPGDYTLRVDDVDHSVRLMDLPDLMVLLCELDIDWSALTFTTTFTNTGSTFTNTGSLPVYGTAVPSGGTTTVPTVYPTGWVEFDVDTTSSSLFDRVKDYFR